MSNYSKLFGSIIGGIVGLSTAAGVNADALIPPEMQGALATLLGSMFGTWVAPKNAPPPTSD